MAHYQIEKYVGNEETPKSFDENHDRYDWILAWGFKPRTYPKVFTDKEAIEVFKKETLKVRKGSYRLFKITSGLGYYTTSNVLISINCSDSNSLKEKEAA